MGMFVWFPGKSSGTAGFAAFVSLYIVYIIGYTIVNITAQTIPSLISNDPKQRPTIGVWVTAFNYLLPMTLTILFNVVMLPKFGGTYTLEYLAAVCRIVLIIAFIGVIMVCAGVSEYDKPESFRGLNNKHNSIKMSEMAAVLKNKSRCSVL